MLGTKELFNLYILLPVLFSFYATYNGILTISIIFSILNILTSIKRNITNYQY